MKHNHAKHHTVKISNILHIIQKGATIPQDLENTSFRCATRKHDLPLVVILEEQCTSNSVSMGITMYDIGISTAWKPHKLAGGNHYTGESFATGFSEQICINL